MIIEKGKKIHWDNQQVLNLGVRNHGGGTKVFRVRLKSKGDVLNIDLSVKLPKLWKSI